MEIEIRVNCGYGALQKKISVPGNTRIEDLLPSLFGRGLAEVAVVGLDAEIEGEYLEKGTLKDCAAFGRYYKLLSLDQFRSVRALMKMSPKG